MVYNIDGVLIYCKTDTCQFSQKNKPHKHVNLTKARDVVCHFADHTSGIQFAERLVTWTDVNLKSVERVIVLLS